VRAPTLPALARRVAAGARLLDRHCPSWGHSFEHQVAGKPIQAAAEAIAAQALAPAAELGCQARGGAP
jgi:hypothetical protein